MKRVPCSFLSASSLIVIDSDCDYDNCCPRQPALAVDNKAAKESRAGILSIVGIFSVFDVFAQNMQYYHDSTLSTNQSSF